MDFPQDVGRRSGDALIQLVHHRQPELAALVSRAPQARTRTSILTGRDDAWLDHCQGTCTDDAPSDGGAKAVGPVQEDDNVIIPQRFTDVPCIGAGIARAALRAIFRGATAMAGILSGIATG